MQKRREVHGERNGFPSRLIWLLWKRLGATVFRSLSKKTGRPPSIVMTYSAPESQPAGEAPSALAAEAFARHQASLLRYATRLLGDSERAKDVVQDTYARMLEQKPETLEGHVAEWLYTVCRRRAFDVMRKEGRVKRFEEGELERLEASGSIPGRSLEAEELKERILALVCNLPANQQEVIRLKFQQGFSYKEISRITELSVSNVGFLIHTAVQRLRREWEKQSR